MTIKHLKFKTTIIVIVVFSFLVSSSVFAQGRESYTYNLEELVEKAKQNIEKINEQLEEKQHKSKMKQKEELAREYFKEGQRLYEQGRLKEAKEKWQKVLELTENPEMKEFIKQTTAVEEKDKAQKGIELTPARKTPAPAEEHMMQPKKMPKKEQPQTITESEKEKPAPEPKPRKKEQTIEKGVELTPMKKTKPEKEKAKPKTRLEKEKVQKQTTRQPEKQKQVLEKTEREEELQRGFALESQREYIERKKETEEKLKQESLTHVKKGKKLYFKGDYKKAKEEFDRALKIYPDSKIARKYLDLISEQYEQAQRKAKEKIEEEKSTQEKQKGTPLSF
jgi:tetratricopeptide (TPR) repeat protein